MPLVIGALAVGILSVFSLQSSVTNRLTDSGDAQVVSLHVQNDVQSAVDITTNSAPPTSPPPCVPTGSSQVQLMAMQLGNGNEITYGTAQSSTDKGYDLWRNVCSSGSTTPNDSDIVAHDLPSSVVTTSPVTITCTSSFAAAACLAGPGNTQAYQNGWVSTLGVTGVTFKVTAPESNYTYQVTAVPVATANSSQLAQVSNPSTGCGFATANTGTYYGTLCFVNFAPWNPNPITGQQQPAQGVTCQSGAFPMSANISNTPFTLDFCLSVSSHFNSNCTGDGWPANCNGQAITGPTSAGTACGVSARSGYNDISAVPLPTYTCPGNNGTGSEAFLGNNGFYTGVAGDPALYTVDEGSTSVITITSIELLSSNGVPATNWQLVTGDAESTDQSEYITWQSNQSLSLLPNSANSPVGNACGSSGQYAPPNYDNVNGLVGVGTTTVECENSPSENHTGTAMLNAMTPTSLTVTLFGTGLQAMFLGVILP